MAASDAASLAIAASCGGNKIKLVNADVQYCYLVLFGAGWHCTLVKGFFESRSSAAFQVSRRALSNATAMSASLN